MTGTEDQTLTCPAPVPASPPDGHAGVPRPSGPPHSPQAATGPRSTTPPFAPADLALVALIAEGLHNPEIGVKLGLTRDQVSRLSGYLLTRHHVHHRAGLVALACRAGQLQPGSVVDGPLPWRQAAVLPGVAAGLTDQQIADRLILSRDAVKARVRLLLAQLGATNRAQAVYLAYQVGLLPGATR